LRYYILNKISNIPRKTHSPWNNPRAPKVQGNQGRHQKCG